jgi:RHS repeat-associated protein
MIRSVIVIFETYNVILQNGVKRARTHNAANELQNIAAHDANGNMTLMPALKGKYDAWNRLIEVRNTNDVLIAQYEYNALNQRIKKTVGSVVIQSFFNENWQELESKTGAELTTYIWGLRYVDDLVLREKATEKLYSIADPNWNVIAICDNTGDIQERYTYNAFGKRNVYNAIFVAQIESAFNWNRAFTGQVLDSKTGLMLYRHRFYHVELGRFVSRDPIGYLQQEFNVYRYVRNSSIFVLDASGLGPSVGLDIGISTHVYDGIGGGVGINVSQTRSPCCDSEGNYNPFGMIETEVVFNVTVGIGLGGSFRILGTYHELLWTGPQVSVFSRVSSSNSVCGKWPDCMSICTSGVKVQLGNSLSLGAGIYSVTGEIDGSGSVSACFNIGRQCHKTGLVIKFCGRVGIDVTANVFWGRTSYHFIDFIEGCYEFQVLSLMGR